MIKLKPMEVSNDDGIVVQSDVDPQVLKKIRLINFIEPFIAYGLTLLIIWTSMLEKVWWMYTGLGIILIWILFISPAWHYFILNEKEIFLRPEQRNFWFWFFECRGLGSPKKYYQKDESGKPGFIKNWDAIKKMLILWDILFAAAIYEFNTQFDGFVNTIFGDVTALTRLATGVLAIGLIDLLLVFVLFPFMMRLDNFIEGWNKILRFFVVVGIPLVFLFNLFFQIFWDPLQSLQGAYAMKGDDPFTRIKELTFVGVGGQWAGYIAWGWLQQLLFLSIFSTNFARAFDLKGDVKAPYIAAFFSALFFGLIHLPNFWLSILTWIAGYLWALAFLRNRNLMIMGIAHGMLGTLGNKLLPISYNVGPSSV